MVHIGTVCYSVKYISEVATLWVAIIPYGIVSGNIEGHDLFPTKSRKTNRAGPHNNNNKTTTITFDKLEKTVMKGGGPARI